VFGKSVPSTMRSARSGNRWAMTAVRQGWRASTSPNGPGPVNGPGTGPPPQCTTTGTAASANCPQTAVEQRIARVVRPDAGVVEAQRRPCLSARPIALRISFCASRSASTCRLS